MNGKIETNEWVLAVLECGMREIREAEQPVVRWEFGDRVVYRGISCDEAAKRRHSLLSQYAAVVSGRGW